MSGNNEMRACVDASNSASVLCTDIHMRPPVVRYPPCTNPLPSSLRMDVEIWASYTDYQFVY